MGLNDLESAVETTISSGAFEGFAMAYIDYGKDDVEKETNFEELWSVVHGTIADIRYEAIRTILGPIRELQSIGGLRSTKEVIRINQAIEPVIEPYQEAFATLTKLRERYQF